MCVSVLARVLIGAIFCHVALWGPFGGATICRHQSVGENEKTTGRMLIHLIVIRSVVPAFAVAVLVGTPSMLDKVRPGSGCLWWLGGPCRRLIIFLHYVGAECHIGLGPSETRVPSASGSRQGR